MVEEKGRLKAIVAISPEGIIAVNGKMPWYVSEDLKRFKRLTINDVVIYGRGTFESFNSKPLSQRHNFIVSKTLRYSDIKDIDVTQFFEIDYAINTAQLMYPDRDIWIIGGASIYKQTLPIVDELYLTIIKEDCINYSEFSSNDNILYLDDYPHIVNNLFNLSNEEETEQAIYKTYKRKVSNFSPPVAAVFSTAFS